MKDLLGREIPDNLHLSIQREVLAEVLWEYGEDDLARQVMAATDDDMEQIARLALWHRKNDPEPVTSGRIHARGAIEFFELGTRDTVRRRRRTRPRAERYDAALLVDTEGEA
jgi:hypothetical protein